MNLGDLCTCNVGDSYHLRTFHHVILGHNCYYSRVNCCFLLGRIARLISRAPFRTFLRQVFTTFFRLVSWRHIDNYALCSCKSDLMQSSPLTLYRRGLNSRSRMRQFCHLLIFLLPTESELLTTISIYAGVLEAVRFVPTMMSSIHGNLLESLTFFLHSSPTFSVC